MALNTWISTSSGNYGTTGNWSLGAVPQANDFVVLPIGTAAITAGLDQSAVELDGFTVERGYTQNIGTVGEFLQLDIDGPFVFEGQSALAKFDFGGAAISPIINDSGRPSGGYAVHVLGSALVKTTVNRGFVALAPFAGQTATSGIIEVGFIANRAGDSNVLIGSGVTRTTVNAFGGSVMDRAAGTTTNIYDGCTYTTEGTGAHTTINVYGGIFYPTSTGTITTINLYGGTVDSSRLKAAATVTTLNQYSGGALVWNSALLTIGTHNKFGPVKVERA